MKFKVLLPLCATLLTACADYTLLQTDNYNEAGFLNSNYYSFDHPNTEKAESEVRARAEFLCGQYKKVAVKTGGACTLKFCMTSYQCMGAEKAKEFAP